jgi:hypothetical protein
MKAHKAFCLLAVLILSACTTLGTPAPKSFNERLAYGYTSVIQVRDTARVLLQANVISVEDAANIQQTADQARAGLDLARIFGQTPRGEDKLAATLIVLTELQAYLAKRSPK